MLTTIIIKKMLSVILAMLLNFGIITPAAKTQPITFKDGENVKLSYCLFSDTHVMDDAFSGFSWEQAMEDAGNSDKRFDALVVTGDLVNNGLKDEYNVFFDKIDNSDAFDNVVLSTGNHDMRFAYKANHKTIYNKIDNYLNLETSGKDYYSYEINGYTFIVLGTEKAVFERAYISDAQLAFLDNELANATAKSNLTFVICHQPLKNTHGLPGVWRTGDLGDQSNQVRDILCKYRNVIYLNGHLHDGISSRSVEKLSDGVYSFNICAFGKDNDYGQFNDKGLGYFVEVYDDEITFTGRNFVKGKNLDAYWTFNLANGLELADSKY